jgi:hypothetical protein
MFLKIRSKYTKCLNLISETVKLLKGNICEKFHDIILSNILGFFYGGGVGHQNTINRKNKQVVL